MCRGIFMLNEKHIFPYLGFRRPNFFNLKCRMVAHIKIKTKHRVRFPWEMSHCDVTAVIVKNNWEGFCAYLLVNHLCEVRFSWFQVCSCFYWVDSDVFSIFCTSVFGCHSDCHKMTIWAVRFKTVIVISQLLDGLFCHSKLSIVVVRTSYVSFMSHCNVTPIFVNWCIRKTSAGFDESFTCNDPFFIWSTQ